MFFHACKQVHNMIHAIGVQYIDLCVICFECDVKQYGSLSTWMQMSSPLPRQMRISGCCMTARDDLPSTTSTQMKLRYLLLS